MANIKGGYAAGVLGLVGAVGLSPNALAVDFEILGVSNVVISCPADAGSGANCRVANVPKAQCLIGQTPLRVDVYMGPSSMSSDVNAAVPGVAEPGCYNVENITHEALRLRVRDPGNEANSILDLNGGPGSSDGSGIVGTATCTDAAPWNNSLPFLWYGEAGENVNNPDVVVTAKTAPATPIASYTPADAAEWAIFYGAGTFEAEFSARALSQLSQSGTWGAQIVTEARSSLTLVPACEDTTTTTVPSVPAAGSVAVGALGLGLAGLGVMLGFRRRG